MRGVEGGERVLPLPHRERPGGCEQPCGRERGAGDAERSSHRCQEARREAIAVTDGATGWASVRRRVRRVAAGRDGEHLGGHCGPGEHEDEGKGRHVSERRELGKVPGRVEAEPEAQGHRAEDEQWPREAGDVEQRAQPCVSASGLHEPEPRVRGRKHEEQRLGIRADQHKRDDGERGERHGHSGDLVLGLHRPFGNEAASGDEPAGGDHERKEREREPRPVGGRLRRRVDRRLVTAGPGSGEGEER